MGDCKPLTPVTKAKMDSNNTQLGYKSVYSWYNYKNTLTPEQLEELNTKKWRDKIALRKGQLENWKETSSSLILKGNISPPMSLTARRPEDWHLMVTGFNILKNQISPPICQELIAGREEDWYQTGNNAAASYNAWIILLLLLAKCALTTASPLPLQNHQVKLGIVYDSTDHLNCTLEIDNRHVPFFHNRNQDSVQNQAFNSSSVQNLLKTFCEKQRNLMEINLMSLNGRHNQSSGTLQLNLSWKLNTDGTLSNETLQYTFNGQVLPENEAADLPEAIFAANEKQLNMNSSDFMKEIKRHTVTLWEIFRDPLLPFLERATPEDTNPTNVTTIVLAILIPLGVVTVIGMAVIVVKYFGKKTWEIILYVICSKTNTAYSPAVQTELEDVANKDIESPAQKNHVDIICMN